MINSYVTNIFIFSKAIVWGLEGVKRLEMLTPSSSLLKLIELFSPYPRYDAITWRYKIEPRIQSEQPH